MDKPVRSFHFIEESLPDIVGQPYNAHHAIRRPENLKPQKQIATPDSRKQYDMAQNPVQIAPNRDFNCLPKAFSLRSDWP